MLIKTEEFTREPHFLSHAILQSLNGNKEVSEMVKKMPERNGKTEYDFVLTINGIELDVKQFFEMLEKEYDGQVAISAKDQALELLEKYKHEYNSKNHPNAKIQSIKNQMDKCFNQLNNIQKSINELSC